MKKLNYLLILLLLPLSLVSNAQDLNYFLPEGDYNLDKNIPAPKQSLGYEIGDNHVSYDLLVTYFRSLAAISKRVKIEEIGTTYEGRPNIFLIISSEKNILNLDKIRENQLALSDPSKSGKLSIKEMPIVMWFGYSVHGNEASGVNASLAVAYYLTAAQGEKIEKILNESVIIIQPAQNPDGVNRFAQWVNSARSFSGVTDQYSREFREPAPGSRGNHYWFDLNRDWLLVQHPETYNRMKLFMSWHPTLVNDYHEQGSTNGTYFSPGIKNSTNPLAPEKNRILTEEISLYHAKALEKDGVLIFTKEGYDNFYTGKGASYPDMMGAIGILYEQPSSRGHIQIRNGVTLRFKDFIRHQALCSYSAIEAGIDKRVELNRYKAETYKESADLAKASPVKGYVISANSNNSIIKELHRILSAHSVDLYKLKKDMLVKGKTFQSTDSYILPLNQREYRIIRTLFDRMTTYSDTTFYDVSAWTLPLALNLNYEEISETEGFIGPKADKIEYVGKLNCESKIAYLINLKEQSSYTLLYKLLINDINLRVSDLPFKLNSGGKMVDFPAGTILIPVRDQNLNSTALYNFLIKLGSETESDIYGADTSFGIEFDLGSNHFKRITLPKIAIITGKGASYGALGEIWHLLDQKYSIPASLIDASLLGEIDINVYNTIVLSGNYKFPKEINDKLRAWSQLSQNAIIATEQSLSALNEIGVSEIKEQSGRAENLNGVILKAEYNKESPIFYGVTTPYIYLLKRGRSYLEKSGNQVAKYSKEPLASGYIKSESIVKLSESPAILTGNKAIYFADDPVFRGYWYSGSRLFLNSLFFRELIPSQRIQMR